jgi:hypothetical protein
VCAGPTKRAEAVTRRPQCLRAQFGSSDTFNACHGSASAAEADHEIRFFFPQLPLDSALLPTSPQQVQAVCSAPANGPATATATSASTSAAAAVAAVAAAASAGASALKPKGKSLNDVLVRGVAWRGAPLCCALLCAAVLCRALSGTAGNAEHMCGWCGGVVVLV